MEEKSNTSVSVTSAFTPPGEHLLIVKRKHWFNLLFPIITTILFGIFSIVFLYFILLGFLFHPFLFIPVISAVFAIITAILMKIFIDWYFHLYIVTDRKILEVWYTPLFSHVINGILLDQVNCTEIDINTNGLLNEILDMGTITITFDRPTHQEEFSLTNIGNPRKIGMQLSNMFITEQKQTYQPARWYKDEKSNKFKFAGEIFPKTFPV